MSSFKVGVKTPGDKDWNSNGLRFASADAAEDYAVDLARSAPPMTAQRKPRVDPLVPTHAIDRWLSRTHVATPDEDILYAVRNAPGMQSDQRWTPALIRQTERYALWRHHRNFAEYADVMRGH